MACSYTLRLRNPRNCMLENAQENADYCGHCHFWLWSMGVGKENLWIFVLCSLSEKMLMCELLKNTDIYCWITSHPSVCMEKYYSLTMVLASHSAVWVGFSRVVLLLLLLHSASRLGAVLSRDAGMAGFFLSLVSGPLSMWPPLLHAISPKILS